MDRLGRKIAAAAVALLLLSAAAWAAGPPPRGKRKGPDPKGAVRQLEEVKIVGNPERPDVLFFLPRAKFRLLPMRADADWRREILRDDIETSEPPR